MMADHPLDRPVWNALTTRQSGLALGNSHAVRIDPAYGLFAAAADPSPANLAALAAILPEEGQVGTVEAADWPAIPGVVNQPPVGVTSAEANVAPVGESIRSSICWQMGATCSTRVPMPKRMPVSSEPSGHGWMKVVPPVTCPSAAPAGSCFQLMV